MRKPMIIAAAVLGASIGWSTAGYAQQQQRDTTAGQPPAQTPKTAEQKTEGAIEGKGLKGTAAAPDAEGIRDVLASSTEAAFTRGGFDDLVERFVDADRNRIGNFAEQDHDDLNRKIGTFLEAWKAKYNQDFDIDNEELVYTDKVSINQSEIGGQARLAGEKVDADVDADTTRTPAGGTRKDVNVNVQNNTGVDSPDKPAADANRNDPGRNIATVTIPASHGLPQVKVPMIHEFPDAWKIDLPDSVDGPKLKANLSQAMDKVMAQQTQWPADVNAAYLVVSHHVMHALVGQGQSGQSGQGAQAGEGGESAPAGGTR